MSFIDDIQGQNTQLYPIITIEPPDGENRNHYDVLDTECIFLSTNNVSLDHIHSLSNASESRLYGRSFKPLLLNIPSIKESIDIESRKFKISNVSLDISNIEYEGKRFTDILSDTSLMNWKCSIQFVSPSAKFFSTIFGVQGYSVYDYASFYEIYNTLGFDGTADGFTQDKKYKMTQMVYQGVIRRISHDDTKVKIELEDLTEQKAHKDLPQIKDQDGIAGYLGQEDGIPDKSKNKPIPMVYGQVDRSPCVLDMNKAIVIDKRQVHGLNLSEYNIFGDSSPLIIISDDTYIPVLESIEEDLGSFEETDNVDDDGNSLYSSVGLQWGFTGNRIETKQTLLQINNVLQCKLSHKPTSINLLKPEGILDGDDWHGDMSDTYALETLSDEDTKILTDGDYSNSINYESGLITLQQSVNDGLDSLDSHGIYHNTYAKLIISVLPTLEALASRTLKVAINKVFMPIPKDISGNNDRIYVYAGTTGTTETDVQEGLFQGTKKSMAEIEAADCIGISRLFGFPDEDGKAGYNYSTGGDTKDIDISFGVEGHGWDDIYHHNPALFFYDWCNLGGTGVNDNGVYMIYFRGNHDVTTNGTVEAELSIGDNGDFKEIDVSTLIDLDNAFSNDFYANVNGRMNTFADHPDPPTGEVDAAWTNYNIINYIVQNFSSYLNEGDIALFNGYLDGTFPPDNLPQILQDEALANMFSAANSFIASQGITASNFTETLEQFIQNPIDIIYDLVRSELGHDAIDKIEYAEAKLAHPEWKFGFTINKKTNSKKLIEDIAKSTKCFPKFKNDGSFGFNTIKDSYTVGDYENAHQIKESEVISYSFKKTKPEQVYKNTTISYKKDYAQDSYLKTTEEGDYNLGDDQFYGIEDSADAHLEFESDYIRDDETANQLASFLSKQYKNDHLMFNLKLPLQYINLEIGDLVKFKELFGGVKAYGIDYRIVQNPNDQWYYPLFMVISTTKNLDSVSIECMQLHSLTTGVEGSQSENTGFFNDDNEGNLFYFPDSDPIVILNEDIEQFVITAPVITDMNGNPLVDKSYGHDESIPSYNISIPNALVIDGDQAQTDISNLVTINIPDLGMTLENVFEGGDFYIPIGTFEVDTLITAIYSVTSPTTGLTTTVPISISIDVENTPTLNIIPMDTGNFESHEDESYEFTHILYLDDLEGVNYHEKYLYNTSPDQQINYYANDVEDGDLTNSVLFAAIGNLDYLLEGGAEPNLDLFFMAEYYMDAVGLDEYYADVIALVQDSQGLYTWKKWAVLIQPRPEVTLLGDANDDGTLNVLDVVQTVNYIIGNITLGEQGIANADFNQDYIVDVLDIVRIVNQIIDNG
tara:strand:+ start:43 stop:4026 length:3984 start_codon:yes stop_codon:yes gene_type:complete